MKYGTAPRIMGELNLEATEMCYAQYLPIGLAASEGQGDAIRIPENLAWVRPLIGYIAIEDKLDPNLYLYLTVKRIFVSGSDCGNRPGWHSDGFGTDDINYIWCDRAPTEFAIQPFKLSDDCDKSMNEMEQQFSAGTEIVYPVKTLLRLDQFVIHRTPTYCEPGYRTFVKVSISKHRYNLKGNAHNYLFDYKWDMVERKVERNHPTADA